MILEWLAQTPILIVAALVVFAPGVVALYFFGMRGLAVLAAAPLYSVASTAISAIAFGAFGIAWSPLTWGIATAALILAAWLVGRLLGGIPAQRDTDSSRWVLPTAIAVARRPLKRQPRTRRRQSSQGAGRSRAKPFSRLSLPPHTWRGTSP